MSTLLPRYPTDARVLITGGARGLGAACASRFREECLDVVAVDMLEGADHQCDVTSEEDVISLRDAVGDIGILVNCAGIQGPESLLVETSLAAWRKTFQVNVDGIFLMAKHFAPPMVHHGWGRIVNLASMAGKDGNAGQSAYSSSKAAVIGLTKSLGKELARDGVLVNAITPAIIDSPFNADTDPETFARLMDRIPMGRAGQPSEVAALVAWLASNECSFSTGSVYDLSGGRATY